MSADIVICDDFYRDPKAVRDYALSELRSNSYCPYSPRPDCASWRATCFKEWKDCPFKSSDSLVLALSELTSETVDLDFWRLSYPPHGSDADKIPEGKSCKWNCTFHFKPIQKQRLGQGVHNHVTDIWNRVGRDGWVGLIYLNPVAPTDTGLFLWENLDRQRNLDWMTASENWQLIDTLGAVFNRLILTRGDRPHSGADGFSDVLDEGRLYQTFFFKTVAKKVIHPVDLSL